MKKQILCAAVLALTLTASGAAVCMADSAAASSEEGAESTLVEAESGETPAEADSSPDFDEMKWSDFAISVDGDVLQFPMLYADFEALGYEPEDDVTITLQPMQYSWFYYKKGDHRISATITNFANNTIPANECVVCGITIDSYYWPVDEGEILLPQGIVRGSSAREDVEAAYGEPSDVYEGEMYTKLTYETDIYEDLQLEFDIESGLLTDIDIRRIAEPEDYDAGEVSTEVPARVSAYQNPAELSSTLGDFEIRIQDAVYTIPAPVSAFLANGWEINPTNSEEFIPAKSSAWVTLQKGGKNFRSLAKNFEDNAVTIDNGWITAIDTGLQSLNVDAELAGGVTIGMSSEDFEQLLKDTGVEYELDAEDESFHYYNFAKKDWNKYIQVTTYHNGDTYPEDTVLTIEVINSELNEEDPSEVESADENAA